MSIDVCEQRFFVDVTRTDGSPVQLVLTDERDVKWFIGNEKKDRLLRFYWKKRVDRRLGGYA
jgi:hypothetical protein